jgi:hypothetical protein
LLASNTFSFIFLPGNFGFILHTIITFSVWPHKGNREQNQNLVSISVFFW